MEKKEATTSTEVNVAGHASSPSHNSLLAGCPLPLLVTLHAHPSEGTRHAYQLVPWSVQEGHRFSEVLIFRGTLGKAINQSGGEVDSEVVMVERGA